MEKPSKPSSKNPSKKRKPLGPNKADLKNKTKKKKQRHSKTNDIDDSNSGGGVEPSGNGETCDKAEAPLASASAQLKFFLDQFQSANGVQLSSLELESINGIFIFHLFNSFLGLCFVTSSGYVMFG